MRFRRSPLRHESLCAVATLVLCGVATCFSFGAGQEERRSAPNASGSVPSPKLAVQAITKPAASSPMLSADRAKARQLASYSKLPLSFVPNRGQAAPQVKFLSQGRGYTLFLTPCETVLSLYKQSRPSQSFLPGERAKADAESSGVLRMKLAGAYASVEPTGAELLPGKNNYYIGNDSQKWLMNVPSYGRVNYSGVYPGVDLVYYGSNQQQLEYDFVVKAGADPRAIRIAFDLAGMSGEGKNASLSIDSNGDLLIRGADGDLRFRKPQVYQLAYTGDGQGRRNVDGRYVLAPGNEVHFAVTGYDNRFPLIIDPTLAFSSYLGGTGPDTGTGIGVDTNGNVDVTGSTASSNFPSPSDVITHQARRLTAPPSGSGEPVAFVSQINASGTLVYTTFIGGTGGDGASALALDTLNNIYITGTTHSTNFPVTPGAIQSQLYGSSDAFLTILTSTGTITYCTYGGGSDDGAVPANQDGLAIHVDGSGNIYVAGDTDSTNLIGSIGAGHPGYQTSNGGGIDGWLAKISTASGVNLVYVTYFGGSGTDYITAVTADSNGNAYVAGRTNSTNLPIANASNLSPTYGGGAFDAFAAVFSTTGLNLLFSTYLGGQGDDEATGIALDPLYYAAPPGTVYDRFNDVILSPSSATPYSPTNIYVTGFTTDAATFKPSVTTPTDQGGKDVFVVKLDAANQPVNPSCSYTYCLAAGTATTIGSGYAEFFGGSADDTAYGLLVDVSDNGYLVGATASSNFPTVNPTQSSCGGGCDGNTNAFLARLNPEGANLVFSTFLGGSGADVGTAIAQDSVAGIWLAGSTNSTNFPTQNPFQSSLGDSEGNTNAFVADVSGVTAIRNLGGFVTNIMAPNDDTDHGPVSLGASFNSGNGITFFGTTYQSLYVDTNGFVTFGAGGGESGYTPEQLTTTGLPAIIAAYWADVDTDGVGSGLVSFGNDIVDGHTAFGVDWFNVGYFQVETDKLDSFQLVLIDRSDVAAGDFDIEFNYGKIQWEAGDASGGDDGLGGTSAAVGYTSGGETPTNFELPGSLVPGSFLDSNTTTGLIYGGSGSVLGRITFQVRGGQVVQPQGAALTITVTHMPEPVPVTNQLTINITVANGGPQQATGVVVTDALPSNVSFVSATPSQGSCGGTTIVTCNLGSINNGSSATIALVVTVNSGFQVVDTAMVTSTSTNTNAAHNTGSTTASVTGGVPIATFAPTTLTYQHNLNLHCPSKPIMLSNTGGATLQISSIVAAGSFAISNNACGTSLTPGANCEIDVSFTAEAPVGVYTGALTVTDNAQGSPQVVPLRGQVFPPCLMQNSSGTPDILRTTPSATFNISDSQPSCHTSTITMSCTNNQPATCVFNPPTIPPGGSTVLTVQNLNALTTDNFSFTAEGTDKTNTTGVNLLVILSDFSFTTYPTTSTVTAGQTANYSITVAPVNGLSGVVQLVCQGAPAGATCTITPPSVTLAGDVPAQVGVAVSTSGHSLGAPRGGPFAPGPRAPLRLFIELASLLALIALAGWAAISRRRGEGAALPAFTRGRLRLGGLALAALALMLMAWLACGGGGGGGSYSSNAGTAAGTYSITVTGTYSSSTGQQTSLTHTQSLTLQVD